tara:strand:- start:179 stop:958 length:780 start_codon:yes stop_codon:yes gene_type:complete
MIKNVVISLSGGMDSTSLLLDLINKEYQIYALSFNYGQKHKIELDKAKLNIEYLQSNSISINHKILDISDSMDILSSSLTDNDKKVPYGYYKEENMKSTVVPNRNAIFSSFLYAYALSISKETNEKVDIALGVHAGDHEIYPDCRLEFYEELFNAFKIGNWNTKNINFQLPYLNYTKSDILKSALNACKELNLNFERIFKNTITSYEPDNNGISNGKTASDIERILAFHELGIQDPIEYKTPWRDVLKHALNYEEKYNS